MREESTIRGQGSAPELTAYRNRAFFCSSGRSRSWLSAVKLLLRKRPSFYCLRDIPHGSKLGDRKAPPVCRTGRFRRLASLVSDSKSDWQAEKQENLSLEQIIPGPDRQMGGAKIGQTTLEALIALAIFVVTITTVATVYFGSQSAVVDARLNNQALYLAREDLEEARATARDDFDSLVSSETTSGLYTREIIVEDLSAYNKRVTSRVSWEIDPLRPQEVALVTHITDWKSVVPIAGSCNLGPLSGNWAAPQVLGSGDLGAGNQGTDVVVSLPYAYVSGTASASAKPDIFVFDVSDR